MILLLKNIKIMTQIKWKTQFFNFLLGILFLIPFSLRAENGLIELFPLDRYTQKVDTWIKPSRLDYEIPLLTLEIQKKKKNQFYRHWVGALSPWNPGFVNQQIQKDLKMIQKTAIEKFGNQNKPKDEIGYGKNFRPYDTDWILKIAKNMQISQFKGELYQPKNRGIAVNNLHARLLPTEDVHYFSPTIPGEGYPFDHLQMSSIWVGTPVYILGQSRDQQWLLVLTPDFVVWVRANGIARVNDAFVKQWKEQALINLTAIARTGARLKDESGHYLYSAYVGSVFPAEITTKGFRLMMPVKDADGNAMIKYAKVSDQDVVSMPLKATPKNFGRIISTLIARPYGWGNLHFYNDCSAELKNLFTPFGIWLPRQSNDQVQAGKMVDLSSKNKEQRLAYLLNKGHPLMTLVYVGGHVILYVGKFPLDDLKESKWMAMTYQNLWGLSPRPATKRVVIGRSAFFPMLLEYPEDKSLISQADKKTFQLIYLDE